MEWFRLGVYDKQFRDSKVCKDTFITVGKNSRRVNYMSMFTKRTGTNKYNI